MQGRDVTRELPAWAYAVVFLPQGMGKGFVGVALAYVLGAHGISIAAIAAVTGLFLLPMTWGFFAGPLVDATLSPRLWFAFGAVTASLSFAAFALPPLSPHRGGARGRRRGSLSRHSSGVAHPFTRAGAGGRLRGRPHGAAAQAFTPPHGRR